MAFGKESFSLWGGTATLLVTESARLPAARRAVDRVIADVDAACSTYRDDSELALVHAACGRPVRVSATFHAVLWTALNAAEVTSLIDPLAYGGRTDWRSIRIDEPVGTVALPDGAILDLGSAGLAFAADRAAELAAGEEGCGVLFALGGDLAVAGPMPERGWPVRVRDDHRAGNGRSASGQDITLWMPGGLATSSLAEQAGMSPRGRNVMHILNPSPDLPAGGPWRTISVAAGSCVDADTASIAAIVRGHGAVDWLTSLGLPARLVHADGWATTVAGWPATADQSADQPSVQVAG